MENVNNEIMGEIRAPRTGTEIIKVSARSIPKMTAGAIAAVIREGGKAEVQAVGAGAANQGVKAIAIARTYLAPEGIDLICRPAFTQITIEGDEKTAIAMLAERA
jgi:stage V sporulation protein S